MKFNIANRVKCINGTFAHRFEAFADEQMNVKEKCIDCNYVYIHMSSESYNKITDNIKHQDE